MHLMPQIEAATPLHNSPVRLQHEVERRGHYLVHLPLQGGGSDHQRAPHCVLHLLDAGVHVLHTQVGALASHGDGNASL